MASANDDHDGLPWPFRDIRLARDPVDTWQAGVQPHFVEQGTQKTFEDRRARDVSCVSRQGADTNAFAILNLLCEYGL